MALKFFKRGPHYEGAVQREQFILETIGADPTNNIGETIGIQFSPFTNMSTLRLL